MRMCNIEDGKGVRRMKEEYMDILNEWLENPSWREYYEQAPSEKCREVIGLEFVYSELETEEILEELEAAEKELALEDWQYLYRYAHGPEKKRIHDRIVELGGEI